MRLRLDMTLGELINKLTAPSDPHVTAGWVNIRKDGFPWRQMIADAERGAAEVSRVGRLLMVRETEIERWLSARKIELREAKPTQPVPPQVRDHIASMLHKAGFAAKDRTPEELAAAEEARQRFQASPEGQAQREREARDSAKQVARRERERLERIPRQQAVLSYLKQHPRGLTTEEHCRQHGLSHHMGYCDLNALVKSGTLKRVGAGPTARFYLVSE